MTAIFVVRHAPPEKAGLCYGRLDVPVLPGALEASKTVQDRLHVLLTMEDETGAPGRGASKRPAETPRTVYTSPSARCHKLAQALAESLGARLAVDSRLLELDFGAWEGMPWNDLAGNPAFEAWAADWTQVAPPGGESLPALEARVRAWWESVEGDGPNLLVGHAGVIRALRVLLGEGPWSKIMAEAVPHLQPMTIG